MNILIDLIPQKVNIEGESYDINSDFRTSILFEMMMNDNKLSDEEKIYNALELYYPIIPSNRNEAVKKILWFYRCGRDNNKKSSTGSSTSNNKIYDYDYDDYYIYSAFLTQYNIDLQDIDYLHWWKFKALFESLNDDNLIVKIMGYRSIDLSTIKDKEQKNKYRKLKKMYEIPRPKEEVEKANKIEEALLKGESVQGLLNE